MRKTVDIIARSEIGLSVYDTGNLVNSCIKFHIL